MHDASGTRDYSGRTAAQGSVVRDAAFTTSDDNEDLPNRTAFFEETLGLVSYMSLIHI